MFSTEQVERLERFASPVGDDSAGGPNLRDDDDPRGAFSTMRDARSDAREKERACDDDPDQGGAFPEGWRVIETIAAKALAEQSKDIEIACWQAEALTRRHGLVGLAFSARALAVLVDTFWDNGLWPALDPEDPEARVFAVSGLSGADRDGSLIQPLRKLVLLQMADGRDITVWEYIRAREVAALAAQGKELTTRRDRTPPPDLAAIELIARGPGRPALTALGRDALFAIAEWNAMVASFDRVCGDTITSPSTGRVAKLLEDIVQIVTRYVPENTLAPESREADAEPAAETAGPGTDSPGAALAPRVRTREELLESVLEVALLFREQEPSSPFSYTVEEAVRRARLTLPDLLGEVVSDAGTRAEILVRLGIQPG